MFNKFLRQAKQSLPHVSGKSSSQGSQLRRIGLIGAAGVGTGLSLHLCFSTITIPEPLADDIRHLHERQQAMKAQASRSGTNATHTEKSSSPSSYTSALTSPEPKKTSTMASAYEATSPVGMVSGALDDMITSGIRFLTALRTTKYNTTRRRTIVVFVDGSPYADTAFASALRMKGSNDILRVVYLIPAETLVTGSREVNLGGGRVAVTPGTIDISSLGPAEEQIRAHMQKYEEFIRQQRKLSRKYGNEKAETRHNTHNQSSEMTSSLSSSLPVVGKASSAAPALDSNSEVYYNNLHSYARSLTTGTNSTTETSSKNNLSSVTDRGIGEHLVLQNGDLEPTSPPSKASVPSIDARLAEEASPYDGITFTARTASSVNNAAVDLLRKWNADVAVVGSRDLGPLQRMFLGSFSSHLVDHAGCDVYVARCRVPEQIPTEPHRPTSALAGQKPVYSAVDGWDVRVTNTLAELKDRLVGPRRAD